MIEYILTPQSIEALGWTLLHSVWQGAVFAIFLVLVLIALRSYTAQARYVVAVGLLFAFFLTVSITFWQQWETANSHRALSVQQLNTPSTDGVLIINNNREQVLPPDSDGKNVAPITSEISSGDQANWLHAFKDYFDYHLPLLVTIWFLGVLFLQLRFLGQLAYVQRLKHYGTQLFPSTWNDTIEELEGKLRIQKKVNYLTSMRITSPMVIGWLKPVVLMPQQLFHTLSETEIYEILAHELAHIRREDFIVNLLQTFLCNVFFFHPGVWWMSNRIDEEREHCCDDLAVAATGSATSYAKTLISVTEFQLQMKNTTSLAVAFSGKHKKRERGGFTGRIRRLFTTSKSAANFKEGFATACILVAALFLGVVATGHTVSPTDTPTPSDQNPTTIIADKPTLTGNETNNNNPTTTTIITTSVEEAPIPNGSQTTISRDLPISAPVPPTAPEKPVPPIALNETRIDALIMALSLIHI